MNTTEGNKLIAEFMGAEIDGLNYRVVAYDNIKVCMHPAQLKYHNSWDWLMPVVEKIESLGANVLIGRMLCDIKYTNPLNEDEIFEIRIVSGIKINAVNGAVVKFIKWYNENK